jgi:RecA/RadA recombinase
MPLNAPGKEIEEVKEKSVLPEFLFLKTSSPTINTALGGGFLRGTVNGIYGLWSTGKSVICQDLARNVAQNKGTVCVIDGDAGWNIPAKIGIITSLGEKIISVDDLIKTGILKGSDYVILTTQYQIYLNSLLEKSGIKIHTPKTMEELLKTIKDVVSKDIYDLFLIDSITLFFKSDVCANKNTNREYGGQYLPIIAQIMILLDKYIRSGATVVCTIQRMSEIGLEKQAKLKPNEEFREWVGSDIPAYYFNSILETKKDENTFKMFLRKNRGNLVDINKGFIFFPISGGIS